MVPYLALLRPLNCAMAALAVLIGWLLVAPPSPELGLAMLAAFLITGGGNAINDYADIEADKVNRPSRPIPSGRVSPRTALALSLALMVSGVAFAALLTPLALAIALLNALLLSAYSASLKHKILVGNIAVSYLVGSTFLFGGAAANRELAPLVLLFLLAFFSNLARELMKTLQDIEGDRASLLKRLAGKSPSKGARFDLSSLQPELRHRDAILLMGILSLLLAILVSPLPYLLAILGPAFLAPLVPADLFLFLALAGALRSFRSRKPAFYGNLSKRIKFGMAFGLLAFIAGSL